MMKRGTLPTEMTHWYEHYHHLERLYTEDQA